MRRVVPVLEGDVSEILDAFSGAWKSCGGGSRLVFDNDAWDELVISGRFCDNARHLNDQINRADFRLTR